MVTLLGTIARQAVNVGFWAGVSLIVLKALDDIVSVKRKDQIQHAINSLTLRLADISLDSMYNGFRKDRAQHALALIAFCYVALALFRAVAVNPLGLGEDAENILVVSH